MGKDETTKKNLALKPAESADPGLRASYLLVLSSSGTHAVGRMFALDGHEAVLGRSPEADIIIDEEGVSRRHARILIEGADTILTDLGSTNGTFVNGNRAERAVLQEGDKVQIGSTLFKYTLQDALDEKFQRRLYDSAVRDPLTDIYNRRYFMDRFESEFAHCSRHERPLSVAVFDLDHFKNVNDTYGHGAGDAVLVGVVREAVELIRAGDVVARLGGEEFGVMLRDTPIIGGKRFGERLRAAIEAVEIPWENTVIRVTASVGVAGFDGKTPADANELLRIADECLYEAKRGGRNRVVA